MAEGNEDQASKTEDPTARKLEKLYEQGNWPKSREVNNFVMLAGITLLMAMLLPYNFAQLLELSATLWGDVGGWRVDDAGDAGAIMLLVLQAMAVAVLPALLLLLVAAIFSGLVQTGVLFATDLITPKLSRIALDKGFARLFSLKSVVEFIKALLKIAIIGPIVYYVLMAHQAELLSLGDKDIASFMGTTHELVVRMLVAVLVVIFIMAMADYLYQRFEFMKENRMSIKELRDEMKESEGDPHIRARQRQIRMDQARKRMMQNVPKSNVIITNPQHYSIALRYNPDEGDDAPVLVAKGIDQVAMKIREIAREHDIPLYEDPPLARQLYKDVELDQQVPLDLFEATAKVIAFVYNLKKKVA